MIEKLHYLPSIVKLDKSQPTSPCPYFPDASVVEGIVAVEGVADRQLARSELDNARYKKESVRY